MNNYLKSIKPVLYSLIIIIVIEFIIFCFSDSEKLKEKIIINNFRSFIYLKPDNYLINVISLKLHLLSHKKYRTVIIGDSTGYFNLNPLFFDFKSINLASYYIVGWTGFNNILKYNLKQNNSLKYVILSINPSMLSQKLKNNINIDSQINSIFFSPWKSINYLPSISYRELIFNELFYYPLNIKYYKEPFNESIKYLITNNSHIYKLNVNDNNLTKNFLELYKGWFPLAYKSSYTEQNRTFCSYYRFNEEFEFQNNLTFNLKKLDQFNQIIKKHNLKLIVIFAPVPCIISKKELEFNNQIKNYQLANPDIIFPFELYYNFPVEDFADDVHLLENGSIKFSKLVNEKIKNYID
jgi:hypothetical protein